MAFYHGVTHAATVQPESIMSEVLAALPMSDDTEESITVFGLVADMIKRFVLFL
jgi:hypothetical protein